MSDYNYHEKDHFFAIDGFTGVDLRVHGSESPGTARRSVNFRYTGNDTLRARCGFAPLLELPYDIRVLRSFKLRGNEILLAIAGSKVYRINQDTKTASEIGTIASAVVVPVFFAYAHKIYIIDGTGIFSYDGTSFEGENGYIPLYAVAKANIVPAGDEDFMLRERANGLTPLVRQIIYGATNTLDYQLYGSVNEIVSVSCDGVLLEPYRYTLYQYNYGDEHIIFSNCPDPDCKIEVTCITNETNANATSMGGAILAARDAGIYGSVTESRIYLFSSGEDGRVYYSEPIDAEYAPQLEFDEAREVYFPSGNSFLVGQGEFPVSAACRFLDRLFIFTAQDAWYINTENVGQAKPLHSNIGCTVADGAFSLDNNPITVGSGGLYMWENTTSSYGECSAELCSEEIEPELSAALLEGATYGVCRARDEIWICPSVDYGSGAWIYNWQRGIYYRFEGFLAEHIAEGNGDIIFSHGKKIFAFSQDNIADNAGGDDLPITAVWENRYFNFNGYPEKKRLHRASFTVLPAGGSIALSVLADNGRECQCDDNGLLANTSAPAAVPYTFSMRAAVGRFYTAKLRLTSVGGRSEITGATLGVEII